MSALVVLEFQVPWVTYAGWMNAVDSGSLYHNQSTLKKKKKTDRTPWSGDTHTKCQYIEYVEDIQKDKVVYFGVWLYNPGYKNNLEKDSSLFLQV